VQYAADTPMDTWHTIDDATNGMYDYSIQKNEDYSQILQMMAEAGVEAPDPEPEAYGQGGVVWSRVCYEFTAEGGLGFRVEEFFDSKSGGGKRGRPAKVEPTKAEDSDAEDGCCLEYALSDDDAHVCDADEEEGPFVEQGDFQ